MFASCFRCHKPEHKTENTTRSSDKHPPSIITSQTWNHSRYIKVNPIQQTITKQIFKADQPGDRRQVSNFTRLVEKEKNCQIIVNFFLIFARLDLFHFLKRIFSFHLLAEDFIEFLCKAHCFGERRRRKTMRHFRCSFVFLFWMLTRHENCVVSSFVAAVLDFKWQLLK